MQSKVFPLLILLMVILCRPAGADNPSGQQAGASSATSSAQSGKYNKVSGPSQAGGDASCHVLKTPPDLPNFPGYTGKSKFRSGLIYANSNTGPTYLLRYTAAAEPEDVSNWYKDTLRQMHWMVSAPRPNMVNATYKTNSCSISTYAPSLKNANCDFGITYQMGKEQ